MWPSWIVHEKTRKVCCTYVFFLMTGGILLLNSKPLTEFIGMTTILPSLHSLSSFLLSSALLSCSLSSPSTFLHYSFIAFSSLIPFFVPLFFFQFGSIQVHFCCSFHHPEHHRRTHHATTGEKTFIVQLHGWYGQWCTGTTQFAGLALFVSLKQERGERRE